MNLNLKKNLESFLSVHFGTKEKGRKIQLKTYIGQACMLCYNVIFKSLMIGDIASFSCLG